ncbi:hypothetical protein POSPLADRAFT_1041508 [Postia placenta MAD-698-R-SB12]|uniref:Uncharacterized protein n=1 Tax=Postia placenta MAD-698-R-SB12 TaxID=670580 RepID=A0A1X6MP75_9APHY|nr:hypothetical protein POSPLADRAFT_1041508 [Postia placenta MAD-698-R-SB12]OSX58026.1 hypothetical protein POSPLADRAFT_1041508 [Postia placenta MAD-698-R-SB12]
MSYATSFGVTHRMVYAYLSTAVRADESVRAQIWIDTKAKNDIMHLCCVAQLAAISESINITNLAPVVSSPSNLLRLRTSADSLRGLHPIAWSPSSRKSGGAQDIGKPPSCLSCSTSFESHHDIMCTVVTHVEPQCTVSLE